MPVAPKCNIQCNFCDRKYDCPNEGRPGVTSAVLSPGQAMYYLDRAVEQDPRIAVVGIAGPGDPFANVEETLTTLELVREKYPEMLLCVASNGLNVAPYAERLAELQVSHVTITINAIDPTIGAEVYRWVRDGKRVFRGLPGATLLVQRQLEAVRELKARDVTVKINSIIIPGVNDEHIEEVAKATSDLGADIINCVPLYPVKNTPFATLPEPSAEEVKRVRTDAGKYLSLMHHCTRCRADAVGLLGEGVSEGISRCFQEAAAQPIIPAENRPYVAVATHEGILVNRHLGEADQLDIYGLTEDGFTRIESRRTPSPGDGSLRWGKLADVLSDCRAVLVASVGQSPQQALEQKGIRVVMMEGLIEEGLQAIFSGQPIRAPLRAEHRCGAGCSGDGTGCG